MNRNRWLVLLAVIGMVVPMAASPAAAWEFSMDGAFTWEYEYRTQAGKHGFFGPYDVDMDSGNAGTGVGYFAPTNMWLGFHYPGNEQVASATRGSSFASGSEGSWNTIYMDTNMQIRMNQALRVRGRYHIGKWYYPGQPYAIGEPPASEYINYMAPGVQRSFSPGYWNTLWLTAELPWGLVTMGKRPSTWGTGIGWNGEENRASESLAFTVPYGPFRFQVGLYPARRGTATYPDAVTGQANTPAYYNQDFDKNNMRHWDMVLPMFTYRSGPIDMGVLFNFMSRHTGGEGKITTPAARITAHTYTDYSEWYGGAYFKYNEGRFFFNGEVDWFHGTTRNRRKAAVAGGAAANISDTYIEHWRAGVVTGMFAGPAKVSALYAWLSGPDRRFGRQIDRTGLQTAVGIRSNSFSNTGYFRPYSYLMVYSYGLGTHMNADTTNGTAEDASIWAGRVDYAVASNLNVYGSFMWADRTTKSGYAWGFIRPYVPAAADLPTYTNVLVQWNPHENASRTVFGGAPNIPDPNLGYEIGAGFDWKLLEDFVVNFTFSYWQPGKWFSYACVDKAIPNWNLNTAAAGPWGWGVYPDRSIDPIYGIELKLTGTF